MSEKPGLLLHVCCAPCAPHVVELLRRDYEVTAFFYNPNIYPPAEYEQRAAEIRRFSEESGFPLIVGEYDAAPWRDIVRGMEILPEGGRRCGVCFRMRLERACREAAARGLEWVTTTLTVSPMKHAARIHQIGREAAAAAGLRFLEADFKKKDGFRISCELSRRHGFYRQDYCGCEFSLRRDYVPGKQNP